MVNNGNNYVSLKVFLWIMGVFVTLALTSYGYIFSQSQSTIAKVQSNQIMIGRLEERLDGILTNVVEIKEILKDHNE